MALLSILKDNYVTDILMVSGTENAQFPTSNILLDRTTAVCRSTGSQMGLVFDLGLIRDIDTVVLYGDATSNLGFYEATAYVSPTQDFTSITGIPLDINIEFGASINKFPAEMGRYVLIEFKSLSVVEVSTVFIGERMDYDTVGFEVNGFSQGYKNTSKNVYNSSNTRYSDIENKAKIMTGTLHALTVSEKADFEDYMSGLDIHTPFVVMVDPDGVVGPDGLYRYSMYCHQTVVPSFKPISGDFWDTKLSLREEI